MRAWLVVVAACGAPQAVPVKPAGPPDLHWLDGRWPSRDEDRVWQEVGGVQWGITLTNVSYQVNVISGHARVLDTYMQSNAGFASLPYERTQLTDTRATFVSKIWSLVFTKDDAGWHSERFSPEQDRKTLMFEGHFDARAGEFARVPAIEQADRAFAADTERDGADGWVRHFDEHGAMWRKDHRVEGDDIRVAIAKTLGAGALRWEPVTSGARRNVGFTLGAATFTPVGGAPEKLTYCTIWIRGADGSWKVLFDIGRPVE